MESHFKRKIEYFSLSYKKRRKPSFSKLNEEHTEEITQYISKQKLAHSVVLNVLAMPLTDIY